METVSWAVIVIVSITFAILALRRSSPTMVLAVSNVIVYAAGMFGTKGTNVAVIAEHSFRSDMSSLFIEPWTLVTSMFVHADIFHLIFNMLFLIAIGLPLEARIGKGKFVMIYVIGGIIGTLIFSITEMFAVTVRLVGASGAISALMGAMLVLYPKERIVFFLGPILTNRFKVWIPITVWFAMQLLFYVFDNSAVAYMAHIGGFAAGAGIAWTIRKRKISKDMHGARNITSLKGLCTAPALKEMYGYAETARDHETREMWTEKILDEVVCPICGSRIRKRMNGFTCTEGHRI